MSRLFEIASNISTPLALGGLFAAILFLILRQMIKANLFPRLTRAMGGDLLKLIIERLFVLALIAMVLGFAGYIFVNARSNPVEYREGVSVTLQPGTKLKDAVKFLAQLDNYTVDFTKSCATVPWEAEVEPGPIMADTTTELIELLRLRIKSAAQSPVYKVKKNQGAGIYEIVCD